MGPLHTAALALCLSLAGAARGLLKAIPSSSDSSNFNPKTGKLETPTKAPQANTTKPAAQANSSKSSSSMVGSAQGNATGGGTKNQTNQTSNASSASTGYFRSTVAGAPVTFKTYEEAMAYILVMNKEVGRLTKAVFKEEASMAKLERRVSHEEVDLLFNQQVWDELNHEAVANAERVALLGKEAGNLGTRFGVVGGGTVGMKKEVQLTAAAVNISNTIGHNVSQLEELIKNTTEGGDIVARLDKIAAAEKSYQEGIKARVQATVRRNLLGLINETRMALKNLTQATRGNGTRAACDPC